MSRHSNMTTGPDVPVPSPGTEIHVLDRPLWGKGRWEDLVCWIVLRDGRYVVSDRQVGPVAVLQDSQDIESLPPGTVLRVVKRFRRRSGVVVEIAH